MRRQKWWQYLFFWRVIRISAVTRISFGLACLVGGVVLLADLLNLIPREDQVRGESRMRLCEALAMQCSLAAQRNDASGVKIALDFMRGRNQDILSAGLRLADGSLLVESGEHQTNWRLKAEDASTADQIHLPIQRGSRLWGTMEVRFSPIVTGGFLGGVIQAPMRLSIFIMIAAGVGFVIYLRRTLKYLDPSAVVPDRVKLMLDSLTEGILILDNKGQIVLANNGFALAFGEDISKLQGRNAADFEWKSPQGDVNAEQLPWRRAIKSGQVETGVPLRCLGPDGQMRLYMVNAAPIVTANGSHRGALATFDDVTSVEKTNSQLRETLELLEKSRDEIQRQNVELNFLATRDPLTGCLNRRSLFAELESRWKVITEDATADMSCIMVDLDYFKLINDRYGHAKGDAVLRQAAEILRGNARKGDLVARYGGEEFCIMLPETDLGVATEMAETIRRAMEGSTGFGIKVTASLGVSSVQSGATTQQELIDHADTALYVAKHRQRNLVIRWDEVPGDLEEEETAAVVDHEGTAPGHGTGGEVGSDGRAAPVPLEMVELLLTAVSYRDVETARHSRRVAVLSGKIGSKLMSVRDCAILEAAALVHDVGKISLPDEIMRKTTVLTEEEWAVMDSHVEMGANFVSNTICCPELVWIVKQQRAWYGGNPSLPGLKSGNEIPLGARILAVAEAFDSMISDRPYRKAMTPTQAVAQLRKESGTRFDPEIVEHFITQVLPTPVMEPVAEAGKNTKAEAEELAVETGPMNKAEVLAGQIQSACAQAQAHALEELVEKIETLAAEVTGTEAEKGAVDLTQKPDTQAEKETGKSKTKKKQEKNAK